MSNVNNDNTDKDNKVKIVRLNSYISYELLRKMKVKEPDTKFILPNGKEAKLNEKQK